MPTQWTSANLTFQISSDGVTFEDLFDIAGQEIMVNVIPGTVVRLSNNWVTSPVYLKFRSGTRKAPVVQSADRVFGVTVQGAGGGGGMGSESAVSYIERTTDLTLVTTDAPFITTNAIVLEAIPYTVRFFSPGLDMTSNCEAVLNLEDNGVSIGQVTTIHANPVSMPFSLLRKFTPTPGSHVLRVVGRRVGSGTAIIRAGSGVAGSNNSFPAFIEIIKS